MRRAVVLVFVALGLSACSEPLEFADWTIPVPEGTRVHEYPGVLAEERAQQRIELVEDLVIGERGDDLNYAFGAGVPWLDVDAEGSIAILDGTRVQVFDPSGEFQRSIGTAGQGPGELARAQQLAIAGDTLVVYDSGNMRFSYWSLDGEHLGEISIVPPRGYISLAGNPDGALIARHMPRPEGLDAERQAAIIRLDGEAQEVVEIARARWPSSMRYPPAGASPTGRSIGFGIATRQPDFALDPGRTVYFGSFEEYQVLAFDLEGGLRWALRVAQPRTSVTGEQIEARMMFVRNFNPEASASELDWPEINYAIDALRVDGHGHLYVFPFVDDSRLRDRPVDVYSSDGDRLFTGTVESRSVDLLWQAARGEHIYGVGRSENGEWQIVRHRLVEPFE